MQTLISFVLLSISTSALAQPPEPAPSTVPRYFEAIQNELNAMGVNAACEATSAERALCTYSHHGRRSDRDFSIRLIYTDETDTVFAYVDRFLIVPPTGATTPAVLRRLMELNWAFLAGKFMWDAADGEVRFAVTLHTDSNFDRRAFRNLLHSLAIHADQKFLELNALLTQEAPPESEHEDQEER